MKAGMRARRFGVLAISVLVLMILAGVVSHAAVTFTTPNSTILPYSLGPLGASVAITPPANTSVLMMGTNTNTTNFGIGTVTLVHIPGTMIRWVGLESPPIATITQGGSTVTGTHVVYLDYNHNVSVQIVSADQIFVVNTSAINQTGTLKEIW